MTSFDVAIIGGGLPGCSAALHLRQRGVSVVLLERGLLGGQASGVNYGGVRQQGRAFAELPVALRSRALWARLPELVGCDCEFSATGHLKLARSDADMAELETYARAAKQHGLVLQLIGKEELHRRYPYLAASLMGASWCAEDGHANPRLVAPAFARAAVRLGAVVRERMPVESARREGAAFAVHLRDGSTIGAGQVINAAGAWGASISSWFGDVAPEEVMAPNMCVTEPIPFFIEPNLGMCGGDIYIRQIRHGSVIFGAGLGVADRESVRARPLAEITCRAARLAIGVIPRLAQALLVRSWTGIEGRMPDDLPVLGPSPSIPGLFHAFGFSGHGFQLGPAVGAILAELAVDGSTSTPIGPLSLARFAPQPTASAVPGAFHEQDH